MELTLVSYDNIEQCSYLSSSVLIILTAWTSTIEAVNSRGNNYTALRVLTDGTVMNKIVKSLIRFRDTIWLSHTRPENFTFEVNGLISKISSTGETRMYLNNDQGECEPKANDDQIEMLPEVRRISISLSIKIKHEWDESKKGVKCVGLRLDANIV